MVLFAVINKANSEGKLLLIRFAVFTEYQQKTHKFFLYLFYLRAITPNTVA